MAKKNKFTLYRETTKNAGGASEDINDIPLTGMDLLLNDMFVNHVFLYRETLNINVLLDALTKALVLFPQLSGRIYSGTDGLPHIKCSDHGFPVT
jgi:hypothetical protein